MASENNAFSWEGQPSIFVTGKDAAAYTGINSRKSAVAAKAEKSHLTINQLFPVVTPVQRKPLDWIQRDSKAKK